MSVRLLLFVACLVALPVPALAQDFIDVDWTTMDSDTLLPYFERQLVLDDDFKRCRYDAGIEYPEFVPVSVHEMSLWRLDRYVSEIGSWPEISAEVGSSRGTGLLDVSFIPLVLRNGVWYKINSFKLVVKKTPQPSRLTAAAQESVARYKGESVLNSGKWYKIRVTDSGVYRMTADFLSRTGFSDPSKVRLYGYGGALLPEQGIENLTDDLEEVPLWRENGSLLFYAQGPLSWSCSSGTYAHQWNTYSRYGYYFITESSDAAPAEVPEMPVYEGSAEIISTTPDYALYEKDAFSWYHSGRTFFDDYDYVNGAVQSYRFRLDDLIAGTVRMDLSFSANGAAASSVEVKVNNVMAGTMNIRGLVSNNVAEQAKSTFHCPSQFVQDNTVQLYHKRQDGVSGRLDYIRLNYTRNLVMHGSSMRFRTASRINASFRISVQGDVVVWNIGSNGSISVVPSVVSDGYCLTSAVSCMAGSEFVAVDTDAEFPEPERVGVVGNQNLHGMESVDMVIIVPSSGRLTAQAERLADAHRKLDNMSVVVVPADKIYNEFSSGTPDATAYRRFLKMIYDHGTGDDRLRYLLLFGDGAWDNRMQTLAWRNMSPDDYLLCYESENSLSETESYVAEDYYGLLEDGKGGKLLSEKVDIGVGRFPVWNVTDATVMVDKTISYMKGEYAGDWQNNIVVLGDDGDNNLHMSQADRLAEMVLDGNPSLNVKKIYWDAYKMESSAAGNTYPTVRNEIFRQLEYGALLVNYTGHGSQSILSHEMVFGMSDFASLTSPRLPLWVTASCDITPFDNTGEMNGKMALLNRKGGAMAMLTTTRTVYSNRNEKINNLFDSYVLKSENGIGDALRLTKVQLASAGGDLTANKLHYVLLGDPAMHLAVPEYRIIVDSVSTGKMKDSKPIAQAGGKMHVAGHVENLDGSRFNGLIYPRLYDSRDKVVTRNNQGADTAFCYYDYARLLFSGSDSVRNGRFSLEMPVPKDISYSGEAGHLLLYARSGDGHTANGHFNDFLVGGTASSEQSDTTGPKITLYLNYPEFPYWGQVNTTPCFIAELEDESGINFSGTGVGHDLILQIDNDTRYSYVLNGYYTASEGDYRRGRVVYQIPQLPIGKHTLAFRAWDIMNNSSMDRLGFEVAEGVSPKVRSVSLTENPARSRTSFVINHDRPGSLATAMVEVIDANRRVLWNTLVNDNARSGVCIIDWNVCSSSGQPLNPGMYIYKVTLVDTDGASLQECGKLVVI